MFKRINVVLLFSFVMLCMLSVNAYTAETVIAKGIGETYEAAKKDAIRNAVEQVVGVYLKSQTQTTNMQLDYDKISTTTDGLVQSFKEVDALKKSDGWEVVLRVTVNPKALNPDNIKDVAKDTMQDRKKMRMFTKENFGNRSVLVLFQEKGCGELSALKKTSAGAAALIHEIEGQLADKSFDVIKEDNLPGMSQLNIKDETADVEEAIKLAKKAKADAIVLASACMGGQQTPDGYLNAYGFTLINAYDATSKRLFANVRKQDKALGAVGAFGVEDVQSRLADKLAKSAVPELIEKLIGYFSTGSHQVIIVNILNIKPVEQDKLLDKLEEKRVDFKIDRQVGSTLVLKINSDEGATSFGRRIRNFAKEAGINLVSERAQGAEITLKKQ